MKILVLTRCKETFLRPGIRTTEDYIKNDLFFSGMRKQFLKAGHEVITRVDDSYFFPASLAYRFPKLYKLSRKVARKIGLSNWDRQLHSKRIARLISDEKVDVLFTEVNFNIDPALIKEMNPDVNLTQWFGILPDLLSKKEVSLVNGFDHLFCPVVYDEWLQQCGIDADKFHYMSSGVYSADDIHHEYDETLAHDVCFVGGLGPVHGNRLEVLEALAQAIPSFVFYGYGEEHIPDGYLLKERYKGWADHHLFRKVFSSCKIAINLSSMEYHQIKKGYNVRLIEIPACKGAMQLCSYHDNLQEFFEEGKEIVTFKDTQEMIGLVEYYLSHDVERKAIADSAYSIALEHTYESKIDRILKAFKN